jgi:hypothetical protein
LTHNGKLQGGMFDDNGNYYINASMVATGILKSANVNVGSNGIEIAEGKTGVYMNLDAGLLWANEFDLLI